MIYLFEDFALDVQRQELRCAADLVPVEPSVFDLLHFLIRNRDHVVSKNELLAHLWKGRIVSESTLTSRITAVRQAVGDNGQDQRVIRTISRKGLRFVCAVREQQGPQDQHGAARILPLPIEAGALADKPSIVVLPFTNVSRDPEQEYFSDGITTDIITALSRLHWFLVIARNSAFVYKGQSVDIRRVGRELDVSYVLEGNIRKAGNRVRVTAALSETRSGTQHWAEKFDYELADIFKIQDDIAESVTGAVLPKLVAAEGLKSRNRSSGDLTGWDLLMRAMMHYGRMTTQESAKAIEILRQAVRKYPDYGPVHSLLAFALLVSSHVGWIPDGDDVRDAAELANRAVQLDDQDPWAHLALGYLQFTRRRTKESLNAYIRALDLSPNFATAYGYAGWALAFDGQSEEAIRYFQQAVRLSPHDPLKAFFYGGTGVAHYYARRYDEAVEWASKAILERPGFAAAHRLLCAALAQAGRVAEVAAAIAKLRAVQPNVSIAWIEKYVPYTDAAMPHFIQGIRKAGLG